MASFPAIPSRFLKTRPASGVAAFILVPWLLVDLAVARPMAMLVLAVFTVAMTGLGFLAFAAMRGRMNPGPRTMIAPALGLLVAGGVVSLAIRPGASPGLVLWTLTALGVAGLVAELRTEREPKPPSVPVGGAVLVMAVVVCLVYFLPGASRDARLTADGGYRWMYVDTQYMTALASSVKGSHGAPTNAGLDTETLNYHYAPFALAGAVSAGTGLDLGDSLVRVVRASSQYALFCAVLGLGMMLGARVKAVRYGGLAAGLGFFFYGSLSSLFSRFKNSTCSTPDDALLFPLPYIDVLSFGGPFSHVILGHSVASGMMGLAAVLAILLYKTSGTGGKRSYPDLFCLLPGLLTTWHMMAGVGALGIVATVTVLFGFRKPANWVAAALTIAGFVAVASGMGYVNYPSAGTMSVDPHLPDQLFSVFVWVFIGLGVRLIAFRWFTDLRHNPAGIILLLALIGFGSITVFIYDPLDSHDWYGIKFLQATVSIYAFVMLAGYLERGERWDVPLLDAVRMTLKTAAVFLGFGVVLKIFGAGATSGPGMGMDYVRLTIISAILAVCGCLALLFLHRRLPTVGRIAVRVVGAVYLLGFLAWLAPWYLFGLGKGGMDVVLSAPEVRVLRMIRDESVPTALLATNHHAWEQFLQKKDRSYAYRPVAERPVLLEGWENVEKLLPSFNSVRRDNDLIFSSTDPARVEEVVRRRGIRYIVARPGTDLAVPGGSTPWLQRMADTGPVAAYRVVDSETLASAATDGR